MGREIKRVPVDFDWPLHYVWPGYCFTTPDCVVLTCPDAHGSDLPWEKDAMCAFHRALWDGPYAKLDPPAGEGWQLWETVSEGSPISPVFATKDGLVDWLCSSAYQFGISRPMQREQAERFVDAGWAPSMVGVPGVGVVSGEQWIGGAS